MTPQDSPAIPSSPVAPRRATPLTPASPLPASPDREAIAAALALARAASATRPCAPSVQTRPAIETKIAAAGHDADAILRTLDTEMALRRAGRSIKGDDQVKALRVLSVAMLFTLLIVALGALSYVQTAFVGHGFKRRAGTSNATAATASPVPDPSTPDVDPDRQSAPPTR